MISITQQDTTDYGYLYLNKKKLKVTYQEPDQMKMKLRRHTMLEELSKVYIPVVGSSANMTDGLAISSHASDKRFFSPPLIPRTFASPTL